MNLQLFILDTLRYMPHWLLTWVAGKPQEIDGNRLDINMQVLAKLSARGSNASDDPPSVDDIRRTAAQFNELNLPTVAGVTVEDTIIELLGNLLKARIYCPESNENRKPAVLFFHQGGLVIMDHLTDSHFCSLIAAHCGAVVFLSIIGCATRKHFLRPLKMRRRFGNTFRPLVKATVSTLTGLRWRATVRAA